LNDSKDVISVERDMIKGEIFSPEILEEIEEYVSDDEDATFESRQKYKR
jgi:hypothetical protein